MSTKESEMSWWVCQGCGHSIHTDDPDMIVDHVLGCDLVDGAGNPTNEEV